MRGCFGRMGSTSCTPFQFDSIARTARDRGFSLQPLDLAVVIVQDLGGFLDAITPTPDLDFDGVSPIPAHHCINEGISGRFKEFEIFRVGSGHAEKVTAQRPLPVNVCTIFGTHPLFFAVGTLSRRRISQGQVLFIARRSVVAFRTPVITDTLLRQPFDFGCKTAIATFVAPCAYAPWGHFRLPNRDPVSFRTRLRMVAVCCLVVGCSVAVLLIAFTGGLYRR